MNIIELTKKYPSHQATLRQLEKIRWGDKLKCAYCNSENTNTYQYKNNPRHYCNNCQKGFSATVS